MPLLPHGFRAALCGAVLAALALIAQPSPSRAGAICTILSDPATGAVLSEQGDCDQRTTPASTFKIALAVIGYQRGVLVDGHTPTYPYRAEYPDWGGADWRQDTDPTRWMRYSVVWYSRLLMREVGLQAVAHDLAAMGYGNADVSGDAGKENGLDRAWLSSSLRISPREQVGFVNRLVTDHLPASAAAQAQARALVQAWQADGWQISGKTGAAYPRRTDGGFDYAHGWGWFVGWATKGTRTVSFARLIQTDQRGSQSPGHATRDSLLADWPALVRGL